MGANKSLELEKFQKAREEADQMYSAWDLEQHKYENQQELTLGVMMYELNQIRYLVATDGKKNEILAQIDKLIHGLEG